MLALDERVRMRDGTLLATDVFTAAGGPPAPALLYRTPYQRGSARAGADPVALARAGWAVVVQDVRGRGDSAGVFTPFLQERLDGRDAVDWCAAQPWCDGRVAMAGGSYLGVSQWMAARGGSPALRALNPTVTTDALRDGWHYEGGAFCAGLVTSWGAQMASTDASLPAAARRRAVRLAEDWRENLGLPLARHPLAELLPDFRRWIDPTDGWYWAQAGGARGARRVDLPAFHVAGWYDVFCEGSIHSYQRMAGTAPSPYARASQRLLIGPWVHAGLFFPVTPEMDFGPAANALADGTPETILRWLRAAVDAEEVPGGVRAFVMGRNRWCELSGWPPPSAPVTFHLVADRPANSRRGGGRLADQPSEHAGADRFLYDPARPVPTRGGRILGPWLPVAGPADQRSVEDRDDVLVYTSAPLAEELLVAGAVTAIVRFASSGASADLTAKLVDVHPDGAAYNVLDSVRRLASTPGRAQLVEVALGNVAHAFLPGHAVRLELSSSNYPRFDRNPSTTARAWEATAWEPASQQVFWGGRSGSRLVLPVPLADLPT